MLWDTVRTSAGLARVAVRFGPTHVLVPEYAAVLRNAPVLAALKLLGVDVVFRIANAPERGRIHDVLWRRVLPPFVTRFVPNSRFSYGRLQETGVPEGKITLIRNAHQPAGRVAAHRRRRRPPGLGPSDHPHASARSRRSRART